MFQNIRLKENSHVRNVNEAISNDQEKNYLCIGEILFKEERMVY